MRRLLLIVISVAALGWLSVQVVSAHPGGTDDSGGHKCHTNCTKWGLQPGQYHNHSGSGSAPAPAPAAPAPAAPAPAAPAPAVAPEPPKEKTADLINKLVKEKGQKGGVLWADLLLESTKGRKTGPTAKTIVPAAVATERLVATTAEDGRVIAIIDGDTVRVAMNGKSEKVRLLSIDTPETKDPRKPVQCFGREASQYITGLALGKIVRLESNPAEDKDRYGRLLRYVYLENGTNVNAEMVRQGYAHAYTKYPTPQLDQMRQLEREAREGRRGLWGLC